MKGDGAKSITELLTLAASEVVPASDREAWDYGWFQHDYRHSELAAFSGCEGPLTMTSQGIDAYENAVTRLLQENQIQARWEAEEFWGIMVFLVAVASEDADDRIEFLEEMIESFRKSGPALTIQLIANLTWGKSPMLFGDAVLGNANVEFLNFVNASASGRTKVSDDLMRSWLDNQVQPRIIGDDATRPVAVACWTIGQDALAREETARQLRNIIDLAILLERDLGEHKIYRRGDINRPGIRGIALDRGAMDRNLNDSAAIELASFPLTINAIGSINPVEWHSAEPLPLGDLLDQTYLREAVQSCLKNNPISNRIRVAARWFAEAHYTEANDDAVLALGVAMDALLSGQRALPGSAMADRFAMLADDPMTRRELVANYLNAYGVRSSVAHGGRSSKLESPDFIDQYRKFVHWAAWRSLALRDKFAVSSENGVDDIYNDLRWGVRSWE